MSWVCMSCNHTVNADAVRLTMRDLNPIPFCGLHGPRALIVDCDQAPNFKWACAHHEPNGEAWFHECEFISASVVSSVVSAYEIHDSDDDDAPLVIRDPDSMMLFQLPGEENGTNPTDIENDSEVDEMLNGIRAMVDEANDAEDELNTLRVLMES